MSTHHVKRRKPFDVRLPDTLHDKIVGDITVALDSLSSSPFTVINSECGKFKVDWLRKNILTKFLGPQTATPEERKSAAIAKWLSMEDRNRETNIRLRFMETDFRRFSSERLFETAAHFISKMIGVSPVNVPLEGRFTNGASTRVKRGSTAIATKYTGKLHCTKEAWPLFSSFISEQSPLWQAQFDNGICTPEFVESSAMFTVPKSSHIDRVACKEPEINMFLQRGVGDYFRAKLKANGCDLNDQSINRRLARQASLKGEYPLATLDLSSASDCISTSLVYRLLPLEWVLHLESIRVKSTLIDGRVHELEMFSSMGNGFTFELESLIFLALARATAYLTGTRGYISIFGDDIIVPVSLVKILTSVLGFCGLMVNKTKSFSTGYFRESCGGHYYGGNDVTPFYIRAPINTLPRLILFLNQLRAWSVEGDVGLQYETKALHAVWSRYADLVPAFLKGGRELGSDFALITPDNPRKRLSRAQGRRRADQLGALIYWLHRRGEVDDVHFITSFGTFDGDYTVRRNRSWNTGLPHCQMWEEEV